MEIDERIRQRFEELAAKAKKVNASTQVVDVAAYVDGEKFQEWATAALNLLRNVFGEGSVHFRNLQELYAKFIHIAYKESFDRCLAIVQAAREDYEGGYLFNLQQKVNRQLYADILQGAAALEEAGNREAAWVLAVVPLEAVIRELAGAQGLPAAKSTLQNAALLRAGVYDLGMKARIAGWLERRDALLTEERVRLTADELQEMLREIGRFIEEYI